MKIFATQSKISLSYILVLCLSFLAPQVSHAATNNLKQLISLVIEYMNYAIYLIIGLATVSFVWNVYRLYFVADADRTEAGKYVLFSVIGFFVMLSMWGLVNLLGGTLKLDNSGPTQSFGGSSQRQSGSGQSIFGPGGGVQNQQSNGNPINVGNTQSGSVPINVGNTQSGSVPINVGNTQTPGGVVNVGNTQGNDTQIQAGSSGSTGFDDPQDGN